VLNTCKTLVLHNIISPYKTLLFNELYKKCPGLKVLYMADIESNRQWRVQKDDIHFPYEIILDGALDDVSSSKLVLRMWARLNILRPDVLILGGYSYAACWAGFFWAKINRKKIILWSSSNLDDKNRSFLKERLKAFLVKRCDAANTYSQRSKDYIARLGIEQEKVFVTGNTTCNSFYGDEMKKLRANKKALCKQINVPSHNFLYIGRFSSEKNILHLVKSYDRLKLDRWGLILLGDGPQIEEIKAYIRSHFVKNILLPGFKQKEQIPEYLAVSDVFILPSTYEPWGLVVNEAMAAGLPVLVSTKCGCYPDLVKQGVNGFSFDPFDSDELYNLMRKVVEEKFDLPSMGGASLDMIKDYTPERSAKVIAETIDYVSGT
jgi:glycosyltransferase involved in cell wall biosynthesis